MKTAQMHPTITPGLLYDDAPRAIEWLVQAFGFEPVLVVPGAEGKIMHAQLKFGNGGVFLSSGGRTDVPGYYSTPRALGGKVPSGINAYVADPDAHYAQAKASGAEILIPIEDKPYGGRGYTCRDPEGHVWSFGSYDPWAGEGA